MSTNFAIHLQQQMHGSAFAYLNQELGIDLVSVIPTVDLSALANCGEYPAPWTKPEELPADMVKAILPDSRPLVAVRYIHQEDGETRKILEIFFQRYSLQVRPQIKISGDSSTVSAASINHPSISMSEIVSNWAVTHFHGDSIYNARDPSATFRMIKALANGESLDKTNGRYLPMYAIKI